MSNRKFAPTKYNHLETTISALNTKSLDEAFIKQHIRPLFTQSLQNTSAIYLANHSLGRMLDQTEQDVIEGLHNWTYGREDAWDHWFAEMQSFRQQTATLIHAESADCIIPKTSAGQGLRAILNCYDSPIKVLTSSDEFSSIDFILKVFSQRKHIQLECIKPERSNHYYQPDDFLTALRNRPELIVLSMVLFTTGQLLNKLKTLIDAAHQQGALILLDLYHAAGVVPIDVAELDIDFAIGGSYKYLRGGPGASWLYIHPRHLDGSLRTLDTGWFAQDLAFAFERPEIPQYSSGGNAFLESTPAILPFYQARAGLNFTLAIGVQRLRDYSIQQQQLIETLLQRHDIPFLGKTGDRGAFIAIPHPQAGAISTQLKDAGVICDSRENLLRLCPDALNTKEELAIAIDKLSEILRTM